MKVAERDMRRTIWEERWARDDFNPTWGGRGVPVELEHAIRSGWLPATGRMLDIGCGTGELVHCFHGMGYESLGIDIAAAAVAKARAWHGVASGSLRFEVVDICEQPPPGGPFDIILDRGCLHGIPESLRPCYARHVAAVSHRDTRMLLFMRIHRDEGLLSRLPLVRRIERLWHQRGVAGVFRGLFEIERVCITDLRGTGSTKAMPGVVYHLVPRAGLQAATRRSAAA